MKNLLEVARKIENDFERADILRILAPALTKLPYIDLHHLWFETLRILATRDRRSLLSDLRALTPVISSLGKDEAVVEYVMQFKT